MDSSFIKQRLLPLESADQLDWNEFNQNAQKALDKTSELTGYLKLFGDIPLKQIKPASVLITLVKQPVKQSERQTASQSAGQSSSQSDSQSDNQWHVILTKRSRHLRNHAGEICFPGGKFEEKDMNLQITALRETQEEIGLASADLKIIGRLPEQITISQFFVTPYVAILETESELNLNQLNIDKNEVEEVFTVPLDYLVDTKNQKVIKRTIKEVSFSYHSIEYKGYTIWGATARMLVNLSRLLS